MHLAYDDFMKLTPEEYNSICACYTDKEQIQYKDNWERMRILACITIQPHVKGKLTPHKLLPLSWDNTHHTHNDAHKISAEEAKKRREQLIATLGNTYK